MVSVGPGPLHGLDATKQIALHAFSGVCTSRRSKKVKIAGSEMPALRSAQAGIPDSLTGSIQRNDDWLFYMHISKAELRHMPRGERAAAVKV